MSKIKKRETAYRFFSAYQEDPRVKIKKLHSLQDIYKNRASTLEFIKRVRKRKVIVGPSLFCNTGIEVDLLINTKDAYLLFLKLKKIPSVTTLVTFLGEHSLLIFRLGASTLKFGEAVHPTYPSKFRTHHIMPERKGLLPMDLYPSRWDELDWNVYNYMRNPNISFPKVAGKLDVTWKTVKKRFYEILKECKVWTEFFPRGKSAYSQVFLTFKTDFEVGLRDELQKLNRTSILYKVGNTILLTLYLDNNLEMYTFLKLEKKGLIQDLKVSIPVRYWSKLRPVDPMESHPRHQVAQLLQGVQRANL